MLARDNDPATRRCDSALDLDFAHIPILVPYPMSTADAHEAKGVSTLLLSPVLFIPVSNFFPRPDRAKIRADVSLVMIDDPCLDK
jgi:hypothetical protein